MKNPLLLLLLLLLPVCTAASAATPSRRGIARAWVAVEGGDSVQHIEILPIYCFSRPHDMRRYRRLVDQVRKVYPIARYARERMAEMEEVLLTLPTRREQRAYIRRVEADIKEQYTPVLRRMTRSEGKVLLKLIDRETEYTSFEILREFRGGFVAGLWQGVARIFGANLKTEYDSEGEDALLEHIVRLYEAGLL